MRTSTSSVILVSLAFTVVFAFVGKGALGDQYRRNVRVDCAVINNEAIDSFRKLESTTRLVYFTEENIGMELVWAYSHAEPFFSLEEDFKRFALVISKRLVVHIDANITINNCTLMNRTNTQYKTAVVEILASTLLVDAAKLEGTVCYKTRDQRESYHCCRPGRNESGKRATVLCDLEERSIVWLKMLKFLIVVVVVILGYVYVPLLTSRVYSHQPSRQNTCQIELGSNDLDDCLYVYFQPCRSCPHRLGQFLYGFGLVPLIVYISLVCYFAFDWPKFVSRLLEPTSLFCFACYSLRETLNLLLKTNKQNGTVHSNCTNKYCLFCRLYDEKPTESSEAITGQLKLLPRCIFRAAEFIYKNFLKYTRVQPLRRGCTKQFTCRLLLSVPLAILSLAWFLLSVPSCVLLTFPAYGKVENGRYWLHLLHHRVFSGRRVQRRIILLLVGVLEFFLNICACAGYVIIGSVTAYFMVHVSVYVTMLLTLDFDCLTYAACLFLVVFYICYSVRSLAKKYGRLKLIIFEVYNRRRGGVEEGGSYGGDEEDQEYTIRADLYLEVCNKVEPKFRNLLLMLLNLVIFLTFVFVVTACVIIFGPRPGGASALVRSLIALVVGLSPKVTNMFSPSKTDQEKKLLKIRTQVKKEVQIFLQRHPSTSLEYSRDSTD